jgi:hypothetical protein
LLGGALANGFDPRPLAGTPYEQVQVTAEWVTEAGDVIDGSPPFPTATLDGKREDIVVTKGRVSARMIRREGDPVITGSIGRAPAPDVELDAIPVAVEISVDGTVVHTFVPAPDQPGGIRPTLSVVELDPSNDLPEVVLSAYTGGPQCCTTMTVFSARPDGATFATIDAGEYAGGAALLRDIDGDGRFEIVAEDDAFLGAFDDYAASFAPLAIRRVEDGGLRTITTDPRFQPVHRAHLNDIWTWARAQNAIATNGFLAAYLATARLAGQGADAAALVARAHDRTNEIGVAQCQTGGSLDTCAPDKITRKPFPQAVAAFLSARGY